MAIKHESTESHTLRLTVENHTEVFDLSEPIVRELRTRDVNIVFGKTEGRSTLTVNGLEVLRKKDSITIKVEDVKKEEEVVVKMEGGRGLVKNETLEDVLGKVKLEQDSMRLVGLDDGESIEDVQDRDDDNRSASSSQEQDTNTRSSRETRSSSKATQSARGDKIVTTAKKRSRETDTEDAVSVMKDRPKKKTVQPGITTDTDDNGPGYLQSGFQLPSTGATRYISSCSGVKHEAWRVDYETITPEEIMWLETQEKYRKHSGAYKPVAWSALSLAMFRESKRRGRPNTFRPLFRETLGAAWNYKKWRFPGQMDEFPVFTETFNWSVWIKTDDGKKWLLEERGIVPE